MKKYLSVLLYPVFLLAISFSAFAQPVFTGGHKQTLIVCQNSATIPIDYLLVVSDPNTGSTDTWALITPPANGTVSAAYFTTSTGGTLTPAGTTYGPTFSYAGADSFQVQVTDGATTDTTTVYVTVNPLPVAGVITGPSAACVGSSIALTDAAGGGAWSASNTSAAVSGGLVTGLAGGIDTISYSVTNTCATVTATATITVNETPSAITGNRGLCTGLSAAFSDAVGGGDWTSGNTAVVAIGPSSGIATGGFTGITNITYTLTGGCNAITTVTVHATPTAISGASTVCKGASMVLLDPFFAGTWSSSDPTIASVPVTVGLVAGMAAGSATISYTASGCSALKTITVYPTSPITGPGVVCTAASVLLSDSVSTGTWGCPGYAGIISVGPTTGIITGITAGTAMISYTITSSGCIVSRTETVLASPTAITGSRYACFSTTTLLTDATSGGIWTSDNTSIATIGPGTAIVTGVALGTADITYTVPNGCIAAQTITVSPLPVAYTVTGGGPYCIGDTGVHIFLSGSVGGVNYFLHVGGSIAGIQPGSGSGLDFGPDTTLGAYTISATNTITSCASLMTATATVTSLPVVVPSVHIGVSTGDTICAGTISTFSATPVNGGLAPWYEWKINGAPAGIDTFFYSFGPANGDIVTVTLASNATCARPDTITDTVIMSVAPHETPAVTFTTSPSDTICLGNAMTITPIPFYGGPAPVYNYFKGGIQVGTGHHYSFKPVAGDVVNCYMISDYYCRTSDTAIANIGVTVDTPIMPSFIIVANPPVLTAPGIPDTLSVVLADPYGSFRYQWTVNRFDIPGATNGTFVSDSFNYLSDDSVTCTVTRLGACQLTTFNWMFVPNNVGVRPVNNAGINVTVLPNPNKGWFTVSGTLGTTLDEEVTLALTDMLGRQVYQNIVIATGGDINERVQLANIANGMYLLNVRSQQSNKVFHIVVAQ